MSFDYDYYRDEVEKIVEDAFESVDLVYPERVYLPVDAKHCGDRGDCVPLKWAKAYGNLVYDPDEGYGYRLYVDVGRAYGGVFDLVEVDLPDLDSLFLEELRERLPAFVSRVAEEVVYSAVERAIRDGFRDVAQSRSSDSGFRCNYDDDSDRLYCDVVDVDNVLSLVLSPKWE